MHEQHQNDDCVRAASANGPTGERLGVPSSLPAPPVRRPCAPCALVWALVGWALSAASPQRLMCSGTSAAFLSRWPVIGGAPYGSGRSGAWWGRGRRLAGLALMVLLVLFGRYLLLNSQSVARHDGSVVVHEAGVQARARGYSCGSLASPCCSRPPSGLRCPPFCRVSRHQHEEGKLSSKLCVPTAQPDLQPCPPGCYPMIVDR